MPHAERAPRRSRHHSSPAGVDPAETASSESPPAGSRSVHAAQRIRLCEGDTPFYGPGPHELLTRVAETGSLHRAAKQMQMSYSKAWRLVGEAEAHFGVRLLERHAGGSAGGGSALTADGTRLLAGFAALQADADAELERLFRRHFGDEPFTRRETAPDAGGDA